MNPSNPAMALPTGRDLLASVVVFLVALPLCMGISIASGMPPAAGLITGMIGGLVVGWLAGSPLQVSGPAAGLAVVVWELVQAEGVATLGLIVVLAGLIQLGAGLLGLGRWFRAVSPAVIHGMLAGIGVLIFASQFHVMLDDRPKSGGLENLSTIPVAIWDGIWPLDGSPHHMAALTGMVTIGSLVLWNRFRPQPLRSLPGALVGVVMGTAVAQIAGFNISFVDVPENIVDAIQLPISVIGRVVEPGIWAEALALAAIASAESLLCATAVDQMHNGPRTQYNRELAAQGVGNILCGALGALPMTGVIVRSSANVEAGARTRWSAILHGAWLLGLVVALPFVLELIPTASLAGILVYTGWKLVNPAVVAKLRRYGRGEVAIYVGVIAAIVFTDLLTGVLLGLALAVLRLLYMTSRLETVSVETQDDGSVRVRLEGVGSFVSLPFLAESLQEVPPQSHVVVDPEGLRFIDLATVELLQAWRKQHEATGGTVLMPDLAVLADELRAARLTGTALAQ